jgi:NtrC-family two-component system sensor histidine kinase KinB
MKTKSKLMVGIGLLFAMITLLTFLSTFYVNKLSKESKNILLANYNTLEYCRQMIIVINNGDQNKIDEQSFQKNLLLQQKNITEVGEAALTQKLAGDFVQLKNNKTDLFILKTVKTDITDIMLLNMEAIVRKDNKAKHTADEASLFIGFTGAVCFLIAFIVLFNLPGNIANPIKRLTESIKEIASENYSQRIHFEKQNEFGELAAAFNTMAQKLEEFKSANLEKLFIEKKRIETLINNMHDPVIGLDENRKILFMNNVALSITGLKIQNVLGKFVKEVAVKNDLLRSLIQDIFDGTTQTNKIPVKIYADNKESYFEKEIIPIKIIPTGETKEKMIGNVILLQNITPYKELDFAKTNFIATVSHELKTPISSIKMSLQLLENKKVGELNTEQQSLIESIKEDAGRLLKITAELLNMTQVESGTIQMTLMPTEAKEIIEYAVSANKAAAEEKQIKLKINIPDNLPKILADNEKTSWVLTNLLSNAIRHSYENSVIFIDVAIESAKIKFSVTDTGQGVPPEYVDKIFDRYFRIPGTKKEGTGLGLSISKEFIEAQGGQITIKSDFGAGSRFEFLLNYVHEN